MLNCCCHNQCTNCQSSLQAPNVKMMSGVFEIHDSCISKLSMFGLGPPDGRKTEYIRAREWWDDILDAIVSVFKGRWK